MGANMTEDCRERYLLPYHRQRIGEFLFVNKTNIARNINAGWADLSTANKVFTRPLCVEVSQGTSGANFNTGTTKPARGILSGRGYHTYNSFVVLPDKAKGTHTTYILAYPYTTSAANTEVIIPFEQRLVFDNGEISKIVARRLQTDSYMINYLLELAASQQRAATQIVVDFHGAWFAGTTFTLSAGKTGMGMIAQDATQVTLSEFLDCRSTGMNHHTFLNGSSTGGREVRNPFDFNNTELTAFMFPGGCTLYCLIFPVDNLYRFYFPR
jgi:hypothetical protein